MILPNADKAVVPIEKLTEYSLNTKHPRGGGKAIVFTSLLGWSIKDSPKLKEILLHVVQTKDAVVHSQDEYGIHYRIDFPLKGRNTTITVRSIWIIRKGENFPRLSTCYIK